MVACTSGPIFEKKKMIWYPGSIFSVQWGGTCPSFTLLCPCIEHLKFESEEFTTIT